MGREINADVSSAHRNRGDLCEVLGVQRRQTEAARRRRIITTEHWQGQ